ncbi:MAG: energy-coupling factor ABC transporter ATP-binding protein [Thermodesulfobacteriota bacterium]
MIQIQNLKYCYPDGTEALKGINLEIFEGEFFLICGPNGSGKTTLLRLLAGLLKPTSGSIRINGLDTLTHSKKIRTFVGIVFQDPDSQILGETVREDISFGPENLGLLKREIKERVDWALKKMDLLEISEKPCYLLSGGEKRRLALAAVMAMKPKIILFDEPFAHLDFLGTKELLKYMIQLHEEGHTIIVTTHDVEKVIAHIDRMAIIQKGEIKGLGQIDEIVKDLPHFGVRPPCYILLGKEKLSWLE